LENGQHYRRDYSSREAKTLSNGRVIDVSDAVASAARLVERSFCQKNANDMTEFRGHTKRPGVQKKTSIFVPKMRGQCLKTFMETSW